MSNRILLGLIRRFKAYDSAAFSEIYDDFKGLIIFYSGKLADEDASQELTIFLLELLYSIDLTAFKADNSDGLRRYIAVSLRNKYIYLSREKQRYGILCNQLYENNAFFTETTDEKISIYEALNTLSKRQRLIMIYKYIYNYSDVEIADMLNISRQAVNRLKNRSVASLKQFYC